MVVGIDPHNPQHSLQQGEEMAAARDPVAADQDGPLQGDQPDHGARAGEAPAGGRKHQLPTEALT